MGKDVAADVLVVLDAVPVDPAVAAALSVDNKEVRSCVNRSLMLEDLLVTEVPEPRAGKCSGYVTISWSYRTTSAGRAMLLRSTGLGMLLPGAVMGATVFIFTSVYRQKIGQPVPLPFSFFREIEGGGAGWLVNKSAIFEFRNGRSEREKNKVVSLTRAERSRR